MEFRISLIPLTDMKHLEYFLKVSRIPAEGPLRRLSKLLTLRLLFQTLFRVCFEDDLGFSFTGNILRGTKVQLNTNRSINESITWLLRKKKPGLVW